jgi:GNAT superfamily N-acetyltransferase
MLSTIEVTYQTECLSDALWSELLPLLQAHYAEVAHHQDLALNPDRARYASIEAVGMLRIYTARSCTADKSVGKMVGYLAALVAPSLHYAPHVFANQDVLFVAPEQRGSRLGVNLIRYAHDCLRAEGVTLLMQHTKAKQGLNIGRMLQRLLGYELVDEIWCKRLDRGD